MTEDQINLSNFDPFLLEGPGLEQIQQELGQQRFPRPALSEAYVAPRTPTEKELVGIWEAILQVEPVGIDDDFFMLGGHSLLATQALARANQTFGIDVPVSVFFSDDDFTIRVLAQLVDQYLLKQADEDELSALLDELKGLSEEEIRSLLADSGESA
jgi:hypothetical protein